MKYEIILASGSPRRRDLLNQIGVQYRVCVSECDESSEESDPAALVALLAERKAAAVAKKAACPSVIIGSDTVVALENTILGKPQNAERASQMLHRISGKQHKVYTGVCVIIKEKDGTKRTRVFSEEATVHIAELTDLQIEEYIKTGEPFDKAGAYACQGNFATYVKRIEGDYNTIVGLPLAALYECLYREGINLRTGETLQG